MTMYYQSAGNGANVYNKSKTSILWAVWLSWPLFGWKFWPVH